MGKIIDAESLFTFKSIGAQIIKACNKQGLYGIDNYMIVAKMLGIELAEATAESIINGEELKA